MAVVVFWHYQEFCIDEGDFLQWAKMRHIQHCEILILAFICGSFLPSAVLLTQLLVSCAGCCFQGSKGTMKIQYYKRNDGHFHRRTHVTCTIQNKRLSFSHKQCNGDRSACSLIPLGGERVSVSSNMYKNQTMVTRKIAAKWKKIKVPLSTFKKRFTFY